MATFFIVIFEYVRWIRVGRKLAIAPNCPSLKVKWVHGTPIWWPFSVFCSVCFYMRLSKQPAYFGAFANKVFLICIGRNETWFIMVETMFSASKVYWQVKLPFNAVYWESDSQHNYNSPHSSIYANVFRCADWRQTCVLAYIILYTLFWYFNYSNDDLHTVVLEIAHFWLSTPRCFVMKLRVETSLFPEYPVEIVQNYILIFCVPLLISNQRGGSTCTGWLCDEAVSRAITQWNHRNN